MAEEQPTIHVRHNRKLYWARRMTSGNWLVKNEQGFWFGTFNNKDFLEKFEKLPEEPGVVPPP